jgi:hypothetical protein
VPFAIEWNRRRRHHRHDAKRAAADARVNIPAETGPES